MASGSDSDSFSEEYVTSESDYDQEESGSDKSDCETDTYFACHKKDCDGIELYRCCHCNEFFCKDHIIPVTESTGWNWNATKNFISFYCEACLIERRH